MTFSLGCIDSRGRLLVRYFENSEQQESKVLEPQEIKKENLGGLLFNKENIGEEGMELLNEEVKYLPIRTLEDFDLNDESFSKLSPQDAQTIYLKMKDNWVLQNNVSLMDELFNVIDHMVELYPNDRTSFFEELWFLLRNNLGANQLNLVYNDLQKATKENEKDKLVRSKVTGNKFPEPQPGGELEEALMKNYEKEFGPLFDITEYNPDKNQLVTIASIGGSPILAVAEVTSLNRIQQALLNSLFTGINKTLDLKTKSKKGH